ncbi:hypothetical protein FOZ61_001535, partial [Perkinsus olseni]
LKNGVDSKGQRKSACIPKEVWEAHFKDVFTRGSERDGFTSGQLEVLKAYGRPERNEFDFPPTLEETLNAIKEAKGGKAPGPDGIQADLLKAGGDFVASELCEIYNQVWPKVNTLECDIPKSWTKSRLVLLYKGKGVGGAKNPNNWRGINLLDTAGKVLSRIVANRLTSISEEWLQDTQQGFRKGRSTANAIQVVKCLQHEARMADRDSIAAFLDIRKAFDRVPRRAMLQALKSIGVPRRMCKYIEKLHDEACIVIDVGDNGRNEGLEIRCERGVRQGCTLGPALFNVLLQACINIAENDLKSTPEGRKALKGVVWDKSAPNGLITSSQNDYESGGVAHLEFADDMVIVAEKWEYLVLWIEALDNVLRPLGIEISGEKSKLMVLNASKGLRRMTDLKSKKMWVDGVALEWVSSFSYLGCVISEDGGLEKEITNRIARARRNFNRIAPIWRSKDLSKNLKMATYSGVVVPALLYGAETWNSSVRDVERIRAFQLSCSRIILGWDKLEHHTRKEIRKEVPLMAPLVNISTRRVRFALKISGMSSSAIVKRATLARFTARRGTSRISGRSKQQWGLRL